MSGSRAIGVLRNEAPSTNSMVSTPLPCRMSETNCRMLPSSSMMKASAPRRSLVAAAASGLAAIRTGCELLASGEADYCLICAAQELDWITCEAYVRWGLIQSGFNEASLFSEGAAAILLDRESGPLMISATHAGYSCPNERDARDRLDAVIADLLPGSRVAVCISGAAGTRLGTAEMSCLERIFPATKVLSPKSVLGESLSCSALQQVIAAALAAAALSAGAATAGLVFGVDSLAKQNLVAVRSGSSHHSLIEYPTGHGTFLCKIGFDVHPLAAGFEDDDFAPAIHFR
jgi:3-oxoacyl-(acyl-carrier-protein) synthase